MPPKRQIAKKYFQRYYFLCFIFLQIAAPHAHQPHYCQRSLSGIFFFFMAAPLFLTGFHLISNVGTPCHRGAQPAAAAWRGMVAVAASGPFVPPGPILAPAYHPHKPPGTPRPPPVPPGRYGRRQGMATFYFITLIFFCTCGHVFFYGGRNTDRRWAAGIPAALDMRSEYRPPMGSRNTGSPGHAVGIPTADGLSEYRQPWTCGRNTDRRWAVGIPTALNIRT